MGAVSRSEKRLRRKTRVRKKIKGSGEIPRLSVYKSLRYIYAQLIDDTTGRTLATASSAEKDLIDGIASPKCVEAAAKVGTALAGRAKEKGIQTAVFDRSGYPYHGRLRALAEAAREGGLTF